MQPSMTTQQSESVAHDTVPRAYARASSRDDAPGEDGDDDVLHATSALPTTTSTEERTTLGRR